MVGGVIQKALVERNIDSQIHIIKVKFKNVLSAKLASFFSWIFPPFSYQGRLYFLKWLVDQQTYERLMTVKADFVISCGSSVASINNFVSQDYQAKSIAILKPGLLAYRRFDWVILPEHDIKGQERNFPFITVTRGAPNLINEQFLNENKEALLSRYSHLKNRTRMTIGLLFGGDAKDVYISEQQTKVLIQQLKEVLSTLRADLLITTSRRTPEKNEQLLWKAFKKDDHCPLLIVPGKEDVPEALGGILGLSDIVIVSGDSISMVSEAASSGKNTIVFLPQMRNEYSQASNKHKLFIHQFNKDGYILSTDIKELASAVYGVAKGKMQTRKLDDDQVLLEAARRVI
jgi:mitochondrial fission protein ELM1